MPMALPPDLDPARIRARLAARRLGSRVTVLARTGSTMDALAAEARSGAPDGSVVIADHQTGGRGRLGRAWEAPPGTALMLSVLFRPDPRRLPAERAGEIPMAVALGALDAIAPWLPAECACRIKWPNDIVVDGAKVAGLLAEARWPADRSGVRGRHEVIVGIGINVWQTAAELPEGAASLAQRSGVITVDSIDRGAAKWPDAGAAAEVGDAAAGWTRAALAAGLLDAADGYYGRLLGGERLVDRWSARLITLGQAVVARRGAETIRGLAVAVADDGALLVRSGEGGLVALHAGDVTLAGTEGAVGETTGPDRAS